MKRAMEIALDKLWNILIALLIGEVTTAFHYGQKKAVWLIAGFVAIVFLVIVISAISWKLRKEED